MHHLKIIGCIMQCICLSISSNSLDSFTLTVDVSSRLYVIASWLPSNIKLKIKQIQTFCPAFKYFYLTCKYHKDFISFQPLFRYHCNSKGDFLVPESLKDLSTCLKMQRWQALKQKNAGLEVYNMTRTFNKGHADLSYVFNCPLIPHSGSLLCHTFF